MDTKLRNPIALLEGFLGGWDTEERALIDAHDPQGDGAMYQRERISTGAAWACSNFSGDLVEIGCLNGSTTVRLAAIARTCGRRVIAIDPYEIGTQNCEGGEFEIFQETLKPYADVIDFMRMRSDDPRAVNALRDREIAMAFIDGLHTFEGARGDLRAVTHAGLIALDDTRWSKEIQLALEMWVLEKGTPRQFIQRPYWRETWIV